MMSYDELLDQIFEEEHKTKLKKDTVSKAKEIRDYPGDDAVRWHRSKPALDLYPYDDDKALGKDIVDSKTPVDVIVNKDGEQVIMDDEDEDVLGPSRNGLHKGTVEANGLLNQTRLSQYAENAKKIDVKESFGAVWHYNYEYRLDHAEGVHGDNLVNDIVNTTKPIAGPDGPRYESLLGDLVDEATGEEGTKDTVNGISGTTPYKAAVAVILKWDRHGAADVLLGNSSAADDRGGRYCFPGGGVDDEDGGDPLRTAIREAFEETSCSVDAKQIIDYPPREGVAFVVCYYESGEPTPNAEFKTMQWFPCESLDSLDNLHETVKPILQRVTPPVFSEEYLKESEDHWDKHWIVKGVAYDVPKGEHHMNSYMKHDHIAQALGARDSKDPAIKQRISRSRSSEGTAIRFGHNKKTGETYADNIHNDDQLRHVQDHIKKSGYKVSKIDIENDDGDIATNIAGDDFMKHNSANSLFNRSKVAQFHESYNEVLDDLFENISSKKPDCYNCGEKVSKDEEHEHEGRTVCRNCHSEINRPSSIPAKDGSLEK